MNFDKENFSKILIKIKNSYGSINQMSEKTQITAAYISKLIRLMYDNAPSPDILWKISNHSNGIISYLDLMKICGYIKEQDIHAEFPSKDVASIHNDINPSTQYYMCPVYSRINANQSNWSEKYLEGRLPINPVMLHITEPEEYFFLRVNGESMNKVVCHGAYALIHKQDTVENGEIAVIFVNEIETVLRKFSKQGDLVVLEPVSSDNNFQIQVYDKTTCIKILGKFVGKFEMSQ